MTTSPGIILLLLVSVFITESHGWDCGGHMLTTATAQLLLPHPVAQFFHNMGRYHMMHYYSVTSLTELSCWADDITNITKQYTPWHYMDQCFAPAGGGANCPSEVGPLPMNIATALRRSRIKLMGMSNSSSLLSRGEQSFWLAMLLHTVGNIHQPLQTTSLFDRRFPHGDEGGSLFLATWQNISLTLHVLHDSVGNLIPKNYFRRPLAQYPDDVTALESMAVVLSLRNFPNSSQPLDTSVDTMLSEGFEAATSKSYVNGTLPFNSTLTWEYVVALQNELTDKLALGGRRLARILYEIYNATHP